MSSWRDADETESLPRFGRHPRGVFLLSLVEFCERFSFYGLSGLLILYLVAPLGAGGLGVERAHALEIVGAFGGATFGAPAVGGWIAGRFWGERRAIGRGGVLILLGHILLGLQPLIPQTSRLTGLIAALGLIVIGTGLLKASISSIIGGLYGPRSEAREMGFVIFTVGVWMGSLLAGPIVGTLGEMVSWHVGFLAAGAGMAVAQGLYAVFARRLLGSVGMQPNWKAGANWRGASGNAAGSPRDGLLLIAVFSLFTMIYSLAFFQFSGSLSLYLSTKVDRSIGGFTIPVTWFLSISNLAFIVLAPAAAILMAGSGRRGFGVLAKQALGLVAIGIAFAGFRLSIGVSEHALALMLFGYILMGLSDALIWPPQLNAITLFAPRATSMVLGLFLMAASVGIFFTGFVANLLSPSGDFRQLFTLLSVLMLLCAGLMMPVRKILSRRFGVAL
ncbi:hypothetical protein HL653_03340 [Sphingomonas sp. AP4-R1]|uniref:peptide MFS transporter n=1 Tax=Sphingomonas sp. AP4-R1 TaxID=2735134 RepID=UPI00149391A3|nr:oligopeptide:H+ symporter [Sphingomonas sp. AP4-R1]QJU56950.1 hypothetical protein HL653_03340 [Sphingomonas sp. AP4-R1]